MPPSKPEIPITGTWCRFATSTALMMFREPPELEIAITQSRAWM